jgi:putative holliday junction resolvase
MLSTVGLWAKEARRKLHPLPILDNLEALLALGGGRERPGLLALDVSKRAIGVAGADASWRLATPLRTIRRRRWQQDLAALEQIVRERGAGVLVIGWPLNMDGSEGPRCQSVGAFAARLDAALGLPILLWDERLTTFAAEHAADDAGLRGRRRAATLDALAAAAILQDALDAVARSERRTAVAELSPPGISSRRA